MQRLLQNFVEGRVYSVASSGIDLYWMKVRRPPHLNSKSTYSPEKAHIIRNHATRQFRAIHSLYAHIRWCLTGTPIQNSLQDLGALVRFLKVPILEETKVFRKYVTVPIQSGAAQRFVNLRRLLEAICLRRTKSLLNLPDPITETHTLDLSVVESAAYHDFGESCRRAIDLAVSGQSLKKANHHVIQAVLGMRLFCNHGSRGLSGKWNPRGLPTDPEEALSYLQTSGKAFCARCDGEVQAVYQMGDRTSGVLTICQHLICGECLPMFEEDLEANMKDGRTQCPSCGHSGPRDSFLLSSAATNTPPQETVYPTKLLALLSNIRGHSPDDKW